MRWFILLTFLKVAYYLVAAISILFNLSVFEKYLPIALIFITSVVFQIALLIILKRPLRLVFTCWIIFTLIELSVVLGNLVYVELTRHYWLFFPSYCILKIYSICRVHWLRTELERHQYAAVGIEYEPL